MSFTNDPIATALVNLQVALDTRQVQAKAEEAAVAINKSLTGGATATGNAAGAALGAGIAAGLQRQVTRITVPITNAFNKISSSVTAAATRISSSGLGKSLNGIFDSLRNFISQNPGVVAAAAAIGAAIVAIGAASVQSAIQLETLSVALGGIFGAGAQQAFADIFAFAARTPFSLQSATSAVIKLGSSLDELDANQLLAVLEPLAQAAAAIGGTEDQINRAVIALTQIAARGKVTADNLRQISEALPNITRIAVIEQLAENMNITEQAARDMLLNGLVPASDGIRAILEAAQNARGAQEALARQSQTLAGRFNTLKDSVQLLLGTIGAPLAAAISEAVRQLNFFIRGTFVGIQQVGELGSHLPIVGDQFAKLRDKITPIIDGLNSIGDSANAAIPDLSFLDNATVSLRETLEGVVDQQEKLIASSDAVKSAQRGLTQAIRDEQRAREDLQDSIEDEQEAKEDLAEVTADLADKEAERAELIADTARDIRDIAKAQRDLEDIGFRLLDIEDDRLETLEKIAELQTGPTADEIASADNKVARAKADLNELLREQQELLDELNQTQEDGIDLSGLTLDQLRTTLAGLKAQTAAQRAVKNQGRSQEDILRDLEDITLDISDAQIQVNDAVQDRIDLDNVVINNQGEIARLNRRLLELENDKADALDNQVTAQEALNLLLAGETPRQIEIRDLDKEIAGLKERQRDAVERVRDAGTTIRDNELQVKDAVQNIKDNQDKISDAKREQAFQSGLQRGNESEINRLLFDRIDLNNRLIGQKTTLAQTGLGTQNNQQLVALFNDPNSVLSKILDGLPNNDPLRIALLQFLASRFTGFAEGTVIKGVNSSFGRLARLGEYGRDEMVLPLQSGADKVWSLLSQNIPKYPALASGVAALAAQQQASIPKLPVATNGRDLLTRKEQEKQADILASAIVRKLIEEGGLNTGLTINNEVQAIQGLDDKQLARLVSKKVERDILDKLSKR